MLYMNNYLISKAKHNKQTNKQTNKQASKQASKQTNKQAINLHMYLGASKHMFTHTSSWKKQIKNLPNLPTKDRQTCVQPGSAGRTEVTTALERLKLSTQNKTDRNKGFEKFQVSNVNKVVVFYLPSIRLGTWKKKTNTWDWKMLGKPSS